MNAWDSCFYTHFKPFWVAYTYSGRVIAGFGIGGISAVTPTFVSECAPKEVGGRIIGLFQIVVAIGAMLSYWINRESPPL